MNAEVSVTKFPPGHAVGIEKFKLNRKALSPKPTTGSVNPNIDYNTKDMNSHILDKLMKGEITRQQAKRLKEQLV
jgi:hypothetical protein